MTLKKKNDFQKIGQFFTEKNVFDFSIFKTWWELIPKEKKLSVLEPFAGKNGIIDMLKELSFIDKATKYISYDIIPGNKDVEYRDTLKSFPNGFHVGVTNPPFLAKNSATRKGLPHRIEPYTDLYEMCLNHCLCNLEYLAIIIPESFLTSPYFKNRLYAVISLTDKKIFKNTEQPVCLALFVPCETTDYQIFRNEKLIGTSQQLKAKDESFCISSSNSFEIKFHQIDGQVGFISTDATSKNKKIKMTSKSDIEEKDIHPYARLRTRILIKKNNKFYSIKNEKKFIDNFNIFLNQYRQETQDVFLTSFKGLRDDGFYRRRISYTKLRQLLLTYLEKK